MRISIPIISISWHGGTRILLEAANYLIRRGYEVTVLCSRGRHASPYLLDPKVRVRHVGVHTRWKQLDYAVFLTLLPFAFPRRSVLMATFFVTYYSVRLAAALRGLCYIYFVQDIESKYQGARGLVLNRLCNFTYRDRRIVAANAHLADRLRVEFGTSCVVAQIGPGEIFFNAPARPGKRYDVIYFARKEPWKGLDRFLRLVSLAGRRFKFLCISQDETVLARLRGDAITCVKPIDDRELIECLDAARVLFFTSYREGFALPPLEAMARSIPSVMYRCGGPESYVRHGMNSFYIEDECRALEVICALLDDHELYERVSAEASRTAEAYRMERGLQALEGYLAGCASGSLARDSGP